ncbi:hypothetical protein TVAG_272270 [Trichomonas vaginalis G3]|uniref:Uncharacterized protein n=1 Tax=Trichomonas vaginalis (strain ATCC PRA-98 / G3) TaxID=412133 RepID=A2FXT3_TRIV3|nr:hypothetical protein TVAGG3_0085050 [Trichomonas vaginalis G3]EAX90294.1 hypothetical protein TVAG_272270 [Trichomonas vaginalis G3]KAI5543541.1 hypothetical protein TVAGG3_0085050 [Trichomonas vaginalis G3]|eukprot:XP_001303224.1 hypothetical protein [Trichomonas vaginalis G3]
MKNDLVNSWLEEDYRENENLINMKAISISIPESPHINKILIPEFEIGGKTKTGKRLNTISTPTIPQDQINLLINLKSENEQLLMQIKEISKKIDKIIPKNNELKDAIYNTKKNLKAILSATDEKEKLHLIKMENERKLEAQAQKEKNRSKNAQTAIFEKMIKLKAESERLTQQEIALEEEAKKFKKAKTEERAILKRKIQLAKQLNDVLTQKRSEIEKSMITPH